MNSPTKAEKLMDYTPTASALVGRVLITGGTGSFGSTMVRKLLRTDVEEIRVFSRDETKQDLMRRGVNDGRVRYYIGDVRDAGAVDRAVRGVDFIFHAAALKQVPSCEFFPMEAVLTNIQGSQNVVERAGMHGVRSVVCLGTDKAVYPVNAMGMTKALMEKVAQAYARNNRTSDTTVSTVRYGNVMCSRGSVIPLFVEQIAAGKSLTLTDPDMTRFLMSLEEAVELVEHAFDHARPGDLFVRKAPASTVGVLAEAVSRLLGVEYQANVIGTRHGEKLFEALATREELVRSEDQGDFYRVPVDARDLNYGDYFDRGDVQESHTDDYTSHNTERLTVEQVMQLVGALPEFVSTVHSHGRSVHL